MGLPSLVPPRAVGLVMEVADPCPGAAEFAAVYLSVHQVPFF